jgi:hypothetical protein
MQNICDFIPDAHNEFSLDYILEDMSFDEEEKVNCDEQMELYTILFKDTNKSRDSSGDTSA